MYFPNIYFYWFFLFDYSWFLADDINSNSILEYEEEKKFYIIQIIIIPKWNKIEHTHTHSYIQVNWPDVIMMMMMMMIRIFMYFFLILQYQLHNKYQKFLLLRFCCLFVLQTNIIRRKLYSNFFFSFYECFKSKNLSILALVDIWHPIDAIQTMIQIKQIHIYIIFEFLAILHFFSLILLFVEI